ncbi:hypothetical protein BGZ54_006029 [Gamsiella multidivaricata]|nr:hypothetical protein BGZ54_006029 [Gamsiella multidivaricata]
MANPTPLANLGTPCSAQDFRNSPLSTASSTPTAVKIGTHLDHRTGQYVILWTDVRRVFRNAQYVIRDGTIIPLMTDADFKELSPPRILCHPGAVLDVFQEVIVQGSRFGNQEDQILPASRNQQYLEPVNKDRDYVTSHYQAEMLSTLRSLLESQSAAQNLLQTLVDRADESNKDVSLHTAVPKPRIEAMDIPEIQELIFQHLERKDFV